MVFINMRPSLRNGWDIGRFAASIGVWASVAGLQQPTCIFSRASLSLASCNWVTQGFC
jgi:hypothetical protein